MSIWTSISSDEWATVDRDWYTAEPNDPQADRERWWFDVAIAKSWHNLIRFSVNNLVEGPGHIEAMLVLDVDEAQRVIADLTEAVARIQGPGPSHLPSQPPP